MTDYSVTWNEVKERVGKELERRGINGNDKISMGSIKVALDKVWDALFEEMHEEEPAKCDVCGYRDAKCVQYVDKYLTGSVRAYMLCPICRMERMRILHEEGLY